MFFIGLLISTVLYGIVCFLVCVLGLGIEFAVIIQQALQPTSLTGCFFAYIFWSLPLFPVMIFIDFISCKIYNRFSYPYTDLPFLSILPGTLLNCILNPFKGLVAFVGARKTIDVGGLDGAYCWTQVIVHFIWAISIIGWISLNFFILLIH